jgi:cobalt/nickel transport system permease protein
VPPRTRGGLYRTSTRSAWLARRLGIPLPVVLTGLAVHRFLFQFTRTLTTLHAAQRARLGFVGSRGTIRSLGLISANLFGQSVARAEALGRGVAARGGLSLRRQHLHEWSPRRLAIIAALGLLAALAGGLP